MVPIGEMRRKGQEYEKAYKQFQELIIAIQDYLKVYPIPKP